MQEEAAEHRNRKTDPAVPGASWLTQEELAERIDRSTQFISTIERGLAGPLWKL